MSSRITGTGTVIAAKALPSRGMTEQGTELAGEASASNTGRATGRTASSALATSPSRTFESLSCSSNDTQATAWPLRSAHCTSRSISEVRGLTRAASRECAACRPEHRTPA
jgi:hypothetical protein